MSDPYGLSASELPPELIAQLVGSQGQKAIAEAMLRQSMQPLEAQQAKGRFQGVVSPLEAIAKVVQGQAARGNIAAADQQVAGIAKQQELGRMNAMQDFRRMADGTPGTMPLVPNDDEGNPMPQVGGVKGDRRAAILNALTNPYLKNSPLLKWEMDDLNKDEARKETLDNRKWTTQQQLDQRRWEVGQRHQAKMDEIAAAERERRISREEADARRAAEKADMAKLIASLKPEPDRKPNIVTDAAGNVTLLDNQGNVIKKMEGAGKPSQAFEKNAIQKKQLSLDLDSAIADLERISKDGGLLDKSTGSGFGALADKAAAFVGKATPGAIAAGELAPIYDKMLKMVPRFEGPQSDKDTQSYKEASGQLANPAIPNAQKKAAARVMLRLMRDRKDQFATADMAPVEQPSAAVQPRVVDW